MLKYDYYEQAIKIINSALMLIELDLFKCLHSKQIFRWLKWLLKIKVYILHPICIVNFSR